jgi:hypothetical protein
MGALLAVAIGCAGKSDFGGAVFGKAVKQYLGEGKIGFDSIVGSRNIGF